jgi:hypothetical protein
MATRRLWVDQVTIAAPGRRLCSPAAAGCGRSKLVGSGGSATANQGTSVALSSDGNTAIIGGPNDNPIGAAWVFTRSGGATPAQGWSVALSADGNTAVPPGNHIRAER